MNKVRAVCFLIIVAVLGSSTLFASSETTVVFLRSAFTGAAISASIYEVTNVETIFIGILKNNKRIDYKTTAGKHTFMVVSEAADFLEADLIADKTYYSVVTPRVGAWKARFSMYPIRNDGTTKFNTGTKKFKKWIKKTKVIEMTDKSLAWYEKHKESVEQKKVEYWPVWGEKTAEALAERTLNASDGV